MDACAIDAWAMEGEAFGVGGRLPKDPPPPLPLPPAVPAPEAGDGDAWAAASWPAALVLPAWVSPARRAKIDCGEPDWE